MINKKRSLRLEIFFAFLIVFVVSFSTFFVAFRLVVDRYIQQDASNKVIAARRTVRSISRSFRESNMYFQSTINQEIELSKVVSGGSDVNVALINAAGTVEWPVASDSYNNGYKVANLLGLAEEQGMVLGDSTLTKVSSDSHEYIISSIYAPSLISYESASSGNYYLIYLDISPYVTFAKELDSILYIAMTAAVFLSLLSSYILSDNLIRSIHKLMHFASKIGSGDFNLRDLNMKTKELDDLANNMNKMAYKLSRADMEQKTFFQNASHELRTPLMSIQGYAEGLKLQIFDDPEPALDIIISESKRLTNMVENLLSISRLDLVNSGLKTINKTGILLQELIDSVIEKVRGTILFSNKEIYLSAPEEDLYVFGNENDLFRAFENLLSNAIRHAESRIDVSITKEGKRVGILVSDDGPGISEDIIDKVFDRFVQGEGGKHGIGLALVHAIVSSHDGFVSASNKKNPENGAIITVQLPLYSPEKHSKKTDRIKK
ncbi:MAG: HAMP domain-containing histidine kinase [Clostridiaceae bacterium]|nr:HAMP domain-containing histidine kinase [Clostridiaceae bacterium]